MGWSGPPSTTSSSEPSPSSSSAPTSDSEPHKALDYASVEDCLTIDQMIEKVSSDFCPVSTFKAELRRVLVFSLVSVRRLPDREPTHSSLDTEASETSEVPCHSFMGGGRCWTGEIASGGEGGLDNAVAREVSPTSFIAFVAKLTVATAFFLLSSARASDDVLLERLIDAERVSSQARSELDASLSLTLLHRSRSVLPSSRTSL